MGNIYDYTGQKIKIGSTGTGLNFGIFAADDQQAVVTTAAAVWTLFDGLVTAHPDYVSKNTLTHGAFTNYEYVFATPAYNNYNSTEYPQDPSISKPKILLTSGVHGYERSAVLANYVLCKALADGSPAMRLFREQIELHVIPIVTPSSFDADSRLNSNGVNINRNFDSNWVLTPVGNQYSGPYAASENETQVVQSWIDNNADASCLLDHHNSQVVNEIAVLMSEDLMEDVKDNIRPFMCAEISHMKIDRGLIGSSFKYYYEATRMTAGAEKGYATKKGVPGFTLETSWNVNNTGKHSNTTIGTDAECAAAILLGLSNWALLNI